MNFLESGKTGNSSVYGVEMLEDKVQFEKAEDRTDALAAIGQFQVAFTIPQGIDGFNEDSDSRGIDPLYIFEIEDDLLQAARDEFIEGGSKLKCFRTSHHGPVGSQDCNIFNNFF